MGECFVEYTSRYGEPILRFLTGASFEQRQFGDIPYECCVFKIDHVTKVMVVSRYGNKDEWHPNCGERSVIVELLGRAAGNQGAVAEQTGNTGSPKLPPCATLEKQYQFFYDGHSEDYKSGFWGGFRICYDIIRRQLRAGA